MNNFTKKRNEYFNKLKSNSVLLTNFIKNCRCIGGKKLEELIVPKNDFELELSNALYTYFSEIYFLSEIKEILIKIEDNSITNLYFEIINRLKSNEFVNSEDYRYFDLRDRVRIIYDALLLSTYNSVIFNDYLHTKCGFDYSLEGWNEFNKHLKESQNIVGKIVENCGEINLSNYEFQKKAIAYMNEFHNLYKTNKVKLTEYHSLYEQEKREKLNNWPYHTSRISKEVEESLLKNGLVKDEEYCVYVNPEYGAFFYNTPEKSIQEEIKSFENIPALDYHVYVPQDVLSAYIDKGYEFVIGPYVKIFDDDNDSLNGVYCINYNKTLEKKR